jgi:hypothetical protein
VSLCKLFSTAPNLGVVTRKWFSDLESRFTTAGIDLTVKTGIDGAASLLAPAALIAQLIKRENLSSDRPLRLLLIADDPVAVMDEGVWLSYAAELAGVHSVDCYSTCTQLIRSSLYGPATQLGIAPYTLVSIEQAQSLEWDLAVWIHPAIESGESSAVIDLLQALRSHNVPLYACMYNELDALIQSHGLISKGLEFAWLDGPLNVTAFSLATVNKFGYATAEVGIEGGWGAVLTQVRPASFQAHENDWDYIRTAMALFRLEGSNSPRWTFGQVIPGVMFNQCKPVGLIGNIAVDPETGILLAECDITKTLIPVGHLWSVHTQTMPQTIYGLVPWAARVKLVANNYLTKEGAKREECVVLLEQAFDNGMVEAGIALARGYESLASVNGKAKADAIYLRIGAAHPMSAYYLAHKAADGGDEQQYMEMLTASADDGYAPAITDLGLVKKNRGQLEQAAKLLAQGMALGDSEAAFALGEMQIGAGFHIPALKTLKSAWSRGHADALNTAHWLCSNMLEHKLGDSGSLKRELKEIKFTISKRSRLVSQAEANGA